MHATVFVTSMLGKNEKQRKPTLEGSRRQVWNVTLKLVVEAFFAYQEINLDLVGKARRQE